jgi:hypothetical protein
LQYFPNTTVQGQDGGSINVRGTLDPIDIDGNISTFANTTYDSLGDRLPPTQSLYHLKRQGAERVTVFDID